MFRLAELNVVQQVINVASSNIVQGAWERGQPLAIHGVCYSPADGILKVSWKALPKSGQGLGAANGWRLLAAQFAVGHPEQSQS